MNVRVNGKDDSVEPGTTIAEYLRARELDSARVAVEVNATIVKKDAYRTTSLHEGDSVEIVHFVGGG